MIAGVYHGGSYWIELAHTYKDSYIIKDIANIPSRIQPVLFDPFKTFGNISRVQKLLLDAVDQEIRDITDVMMKGFHDRKRNSELKMSKVAFL